MAQHTISVVNGRSNGAMCRMKSDLLVHFGLAWRKYWTMARPVSTGSGSMSARLPLVPTICRVPWRQSKLDRKSTRLNSSHTVISYAVFCLKKKKKRKNTQTQIEIECETEYIQ